MIQSAELQAKLAGWRMKAAAGELTEAECKEIVVALRAGRVAAAVSGEAKTRKKAIAVIPNANDLLNMME